MAVKNNPVLGVVACDCGESATVHQTTRGKGRFLYTRCPKCGVDQRTGPAVQKKLWANTVWRDGVEKVKPPGVDDADDWKPPAMAEPLKAAPESVKQEPVKKQKPKAAPESSAAAGAVLGLGLLAGALAFGAAIWKKNAAAPAVKSKPVVVGYDERFR